MSQRSKTIVQARRTLIQPLTLQDKVDLRSQIRQRLSYPPYSAAALFQAFAQNNETYKEVTEATAPMESSDEIGENLADCMSYVDEWELADFIT